MRFLVLLSVFAATAVACSGGGGGGADPTARSPSQPTAATFPNGVQIGSDASIDVSTTRLRVGDELTITGTGWEGGNPVTIHLLTPALARGEERAVDNFVEIGQVEPAQDGTISLRFRLAAEYNTEGQTLTISPGQEWFVSAAQQVTANAQRVARAQRVAIKVEIIEGGSTK